MQNFHSLSSKNETDSERQAIAACRAVEPLSSLSHGWSRVCHEMSLFLRSIGLGIVVTSFQGFFTKNFSEPEKVAIRRSRITALLRTLIHVVPTGVAIFEITLNCKGRFVGSNFDKQNYLQFAAKMHEIAMQASIATVLLSYIRYQISVSKGMPFGAVLGGIQFLQFSYLWSVELWSSILSKNYLLRKKACFVALILICVAVSATAGPSSASLLIARQGLWPTIPRYIAVNASILDIWPDQLDDKEIERDCAIVRMDTPDEDRTRCPISDAYDFLEPEPLGSPFNATLGDAQLLEMCSSGVELCRYLVSSICYTSDKDQYCASIPETKFLDRIYLTQFNNTKMSDQMGELIGYQFVQKNYYESYTIASCVVDVVTNASDKAPLRFPRIAETESELKKDREIFAIPGLTKAQIIEKVSGDNSSFRVDWVDLPMDIFNTGIPGAVIVNSQDPSGSSYNITTCTLNAGWGSTAIMSSTLRPDLIYGYMSNTPSSWPTENLPDDSYGYLISSVPNFANISNFSYPQRRISVSKNWMEFLNPTVIQASNSTGKYISLVLSLQDFQPTEASVARFLSSLLALATTNTGTGYDWKVFTDLKNATRTCDTCLVFEMGYSSYGWLYSARGTTTILSITVMLAYCGLVCGHIIYSAISGVSSTAWDSAAELVVLAMNSSPTENLQNTCAGIIGRRALETPVRVMARTPGHLELVFGEPQDSNAQASKLVMNEKYGTLTSKDKIDSEAPESMGTLRKRAGVQSSE